MCLRVAWSWLRWRCGGNARTGERSTECESVWAVVCLKAWAWQPDWPEWTSTKFWRLLYQALLVRRLAGSCRFERAITYPCSVLPPTDRAQLEGAQKFLEGAAQNNLVCARGSAHGDLVKDFSEFLGMISSARTRSRFIFCLRYAHFDSACVHWLFPVSVLHRVQELCVGRLSFCAVLCARHVPWCWGMFFCVKRGNIHDCQYFLPCVEPNYCPLSICLLSLVY